MRIALVAHDAKKADMVNLLSKYRDVFSKHQLYATEATGKMIKKQLDLDINLLLPGPLGGDQQIGALVAKETIEMVFFLRDPLTAQPHEPDIAALLRVCDVHNVPLATNLGTAELLVNVLRQAV